MEKVKVSREVAEAIERIKAENESVEAVIKRLSQDDLTQSEYKILSELPFMRLVSVLVNGYETEPTPEQLVGEMYRDALLQYAGAQDKTDQAYYDGFTDGIREVLMLLNVKSDGVND